jgi:hypothetical protein
MSKEKRPTRKEIEAGKDEKVREWILSNHPEEKEMIGDFSPTITFREVAERMEKGENFYEICDCSESVQREYCFARLDELYDTNYEYWYQTWLHREPPKSKHVRPPRCNGKFKVITRIVRIKK